MDPLLQLEARLREVLPHGSWLIGDTLATLRGLPAAERAVELSHVEVAVRSPYSAWETMRAWEVVHRQRAEHPNGARLTTALRHGLLSSIAARHRAWMAGVTEVQQLLAAPEDEVPALVERLSAPPPARLENAHAIYLAAARAMPPQLLPRAPPHQGGPMPQLTARGYLEVALLLARQVEGAVAPADRAHANRMLALGEEALKAPDPKLIPALVSAASIPVKPPPLKVIRAVLLEARHLLASPDKVGAAVRAAAKTAAQLTPRPEFLQALDDALCQADCSGAVRRQGKQLSAGVERCLWRGVDRKGRADLWLMRLDDGRFAMLYKLKSRWALLEGPPDAVIASVPEERFADAVRAAEPYRPR